MGVDVPNVSFDRSDIVAGLQLPTVNNFHETHREITIHSHERSPDRARRNDVHAYALLTNDLVA